MVHIVVLFKQRHGVPVSISIMFTYCVQTTLKYTGKAATSVGKAAASLGRALKKGSLVGKKTRAPRAPAATKPQEVHNPEVLLAAQLQKHQASNALSDAKRQHATNPVQDVTGGSSFVVDLAQQQVRKATAEVRRLQKLAPLAPTLPYFSVLQATAVQAVEVPAVPVGTAVPAVEVPEVPAGVPAAELAADPYATEDDTPE